MELTMKELRTRAGHTQFEAAAYLYTSFRVIRRHESGESVSRARLEHYHLKLEKEGKI